HHVLAERLEGRAVAEPRGLVGGQGLDDGVERTPVETTAPQRPDVGVDVGRRSGARERQDARLDQVLLAPVEVDRAASPHEVGHVLEALRGDAHRAVLVGSWVTSRASVGPMSGSGRTRCAWPAVATAPGMPHTTL